MLKSQQGFRSEKYNVFTEEVNKIALSANDDKRIQSIDSIKRYVYGTNKELIHKREEIKCINIIKQYKKWSTMTMLQKKTHTQKKIIQISLKFLTIHTEH